MSIIFQHRIYREDLRNNPDVYYVFGDNLERVGMGGQAGHMRGEPNAIGIATKRAPGMADGDFFSDQFWEMDEVKRDLSRIMDLMRKGKTIVVPSDGIGTGLSELPQRAPNIHAHIRKFFSTYDKPAPWK